VRIAAAPGTYRATVAKPNVLVVVAHPTVGEALETLLRLERRYEVRRATKLGEAQTIARTWPASAVVFDAAMLSPTERVTFGVPTLVLSGRQENAAAALPRIEGAQGWARKDASQPELLAAVDALLPGNVGPTAGPVALALLGGLIVVFGALLLYLVWSAIV